MLRQIQGNSKIGETMNDKKENKELLKEIEQRKKTELVDQDALNYAESIINTVREPLIALDKDLRVVSVSRSSYEVFKTKPEETVGQLVYDLGNKQWDIPKLRELLETILPQKTAFDNYEVEHDFAAIGRRIMLFECPADSKRDWARSGSSFWPSRTSPSVRR